MIATQEITAWAEIEGSNFRLVEAEVDRGTGRTIGSATLKGVVEDTETLSLGDSVSVYVESSNIVDPWDKISDSDGQIFGGKAYSAKQNEKGIVTVTAYEATELMQNELVRLETEDELKPDRVLVDLLTELYGDVARNRVNASPETPFVAKREDFISRPPPRAWRFGSANRGDPLVDVIDRLTSALAAELWVDRYGVINVAPYPETIKWEVPFVTEINSGKDTRNAEQVIFETSGTVSELGQGTSFVHNQSRPSSAARIDGEDGEPPAPERNLSEPNIGVGEDADRQAFDEAVRQDQTRDLGSVTIIGNADIDIYDHVIVPELSYDITGRLDGFLQNRLQSGEYKADSITHKINATDGFTTTIELSPPIQSTFDKIGLTSGADISTEYLSSYSNNVKGQEVSGVSDSTGFVNRLTSLTDSDEEE